MERLDRTISKPVLNKEAYDQRREFYFQAIVQARILENMIESLEEADFTPEEVQSLAFALAKLPEADQKIVLALPYEIRGKLFKRYHTEIEEKKITPEGVVADLLQKNKARGFSLGYHVAPKLIPKQTRPNGEESWTVKGTEIDDRDNSLETTNSNVRMAYYSEDYLSRYKKKPGNYLYVVRAEVGENGTHKRDSNNRWGRAPSLAVIAELDMQDVEKQITASIEKENAVAQGNGA